MSGAMRDGTADGMKTDSQSTLNANLYLLWVETWNKAVALAWRDPGFAKWLVADPKAALEKQFGFVFHDQVDLSVTAIEEGAADPDGRPYGWTNGADGPEGWHLPSTRIELFLPPAPEATEQAVAVMAYWETDEALPFSCSCA